jgi:hypothetical protein
MGKRLFLLASVYILGLILPLSLVHSEGEETLSPTAQIFANVDGNVGAGIIFDSQGRMFAATDQALNMVTPDGKVSVFLDCNTLPKGKSYFFNSPLIWDMAIDKDNNILAAAQDRILKITPDGRVSTLVHENFFGFSGVSGIELDQEDNIYITNGNQIIKYSSDFKEKSILIDGLAKGYFTFFSLEFDPEYKNLYVTDFNRKTLLRYPLNLDGTVNDPLVIVQTPIKNSGGFGALLNIVFAESGNMYVSIDGMTSLLKVDVNGDTEIIKLNQTQIVNHIIAFGRNDYDEDCLYFTTYDGKSIYKYQVGEKGAQK